ncbi:hypothetical protein [Pyrococcus kukulkanii]|uniref:hypothetical protein n=1 Tax=Pyrococcus kukulkanii TaxID=1609559 RepID=UPI0035697FDA
MIRLRDDPIAKIKPADIMISKALTDDEIREVVTHPQIAENIIKHKNELPIYSLVGVVVVKDDTDKFGAKYNFYPAFYRFHIDDLWVNGGLKERVPMVYIDESKVLKFFYDLVTYAQDRKAEFALGFKHAMLGLEEYLTSLLKGEDTPPYTSVLIGDARRVFLYPDQGFLLKRLREHNSIAEAINATVADYRDFILKAISENESAGEFAHPEAIEAITSDEWLEAEVEQLYLTVAYFIIAGVIKPPAFYKPKDPPVLKVVNFIYRLNGFGEL